MRGWLSLGSILLSATVLPAGAQTPSAPASAGPVDPALIEDLVAGSRILADQGVLDAFGHISVRHPKDPNRFLMSRSLAPALVTANDIMAGQSHMKNLVGGSTQRNPYSEQRNAPTRVPLRSGTLDPS